MGGSSRYLPKRVDLAGSLQAPLPMAFARRELLRGNGETQFAALHGATGRPGLLSNSGLRATARLFMGDARATLDRGEEGLPRDPGRIVDPRFFGPRVATGGLPLLDDVAAGLVQPRIDLTQFVLALGLNAEMIEARPFAARRDREIDARIIEHPFGIVGLHHGRRRVEQGRVEFDRIRDVLDRDVNVHALHGDTPLQDAGTLARFGRAGLQTAAGA